MTVAKVFEDAAKEDLASVTIVGITKEGAIRIFSHPDNIVTSHWLLSAGQYSLHQFALSKDDRK
jgi:hypothetical protein